MRKTATCMTILAVLAILAAVVVGQTLNITASGDILASAFGDRTGTTLTNVVAQIGARPCTLILDGGSWQITNNVTFPTNVTLMVSRGAWLDITNGITVTVNGEFLAGHYKAFGGSGTASGSASFLYRMGEWGSVTQYNIGYGDMGSYSTTGDLSSYIQYTKSFWMANGTTGRFDNVIFRGGVGGTITVYQVYATNINAKVATADQVWVRDRWWTSTRVNLAPMISNETVSITPSMTWDDIYNVLDTNTIHRNLGGYTLAINFASGVYDHVACPLTGGWNVGPAYGGGTIVLSGVGADCAATATNATTKQVSVVFTNVTGLTNSCLTISTGDYACYVQGMQFTMDFEHGTNSAGDSYKERSAIIANGSLGGGPGIVYVQKCAIIGDKTNTVTGYGVMAYDGAQVDVSGTAFSTCGYASLGLRRFGVMRSYENATFGAITSPVGAYVEASTLYMSGSQPKGMVSTNLSSQGGKWW